MSLNAVTAMKPEGRQELLTRLSERAAPVYFSMLSSEQQVSVARQRDGGFVVTSTTIERLGTDSEHTIKSCETARYSAQGRFERGNFSEWFQREKQEGGVEVLREQSRVIPEGAADKLLRHIESLTGQKVLGSSNDPYAGAKLPFFVGDISE